MQIDFPRFSLQFLEFLIFGANAPIFDRTIIDSKRTYIPSTDSEFFCQRKNQIALDFGFRLHGNISDNVRIDLKIVMNFRRDLWTYT